MDYEDMDEEELPPEGEGQQGEEEQPGEEAPQEEGPDQPGEGQQPDEEAPQEEDAAQPEQGRIDARPKNNLYMPGTGKGTGLTAVRVGTLNRDGSASPVSALGAATGPLSQPIAKFSPDQLQQIAAQNQQGGGPGSFASRPGRIDARPRNNIYMPGTGPGTGRTAIRVGTLNRDGSASPVSALGAATGPLSQPIARFDSQQLQDIHAQSQGGGGAGDSGDGGNDGADAGNNVAGAGARPGRINARPRNNLYMPGTGPGTGRTAIRVGTLNRDGSASPVSGMGAATGPLSQPQSRLFEQRQPTSDFVQQRQANVANAKASGSFDSIRDKFNSSNAGHYMDENGAISQRGAGGQPGGSTGQPFKVQPPAGPVPGAATPRPPLAAAGNAPKTSFTDGLIKNALPGLPKPPTPAVPGAAATMPAAPKPPLAAAGSQPDVHDKYGLWKKRL